MNSLSIDKLNNLIATNVMEIVKFDQIEKLISDGLLSFPEDIDGIVQYGWRKLKYTCGEKCLIRIGLGDGPENSIVASNMQSKTLQILPVASLSSFHVMYLMCPKIC